MAEIKGTKITERETEVFNAMLALNDVFQKEIIEAEKQENFVRAKKVAKLREHILKTVKGIGDLNIRF